MTKFARHLYARLIFLFARLLNWFGAKGVILKAPKGDDDE